MNKKLIGTLNTRSMTTATQPASGAVARQKHIYVVDFLLSGQSLGELVCEGKTEQAKWVIEFSKAGPNPDLAMTDSVLFVRLRDAITKLMIKGWI